MTTLEGHTGRIWDLVVDSPRAVSKAVAAACRRWRLTQLVVDYGLVERHTFTLAGDDPARLNDAERLHGKYVNRLAPAGYISCEAALAALLSTSTATWTTAASTTTTATATTASDRGGCEDPVWSPSYGPYLKSLVSNRQWPQSRVAAARKLEAGESRCQLCWAAAGTLEHRFACPSIRPSDGWPSPNDKAAKGLSRLTSAQRNCLFTRGFSVAYAPVQGPRNDDFLDWIIPLDDWPEADLTWYVDASGLNPDSDDLLRLCFGLVAVDSVGTLVSQWPSFQGVYASALQKGPMGGPLTS